ncbi:TOMM precursor leader peptide-binding protein [Streptomyces sp. H39-S7]|uniref:TOMM precursor leader peptide-binding protein n=1 Tax=Streptomyces sp. H39-S7 TaxID=3004357 RepID=UPI0022B01472|nr:TOMM precursor leader peptide-binding protein [Streptomyces sp. H39-S7]MCZ4124581.1 TOMM precursor leader peptide-binding protein [Streptomyces sp. H39-S7]
MTASYEEVADTRPRIRRDVLFTETPSGVVFHNAHGGFNLSGKSAYRFASLIVPHLNGASRVEDICGGLGAGQRAMVAELVGALYGRGLARDVAPGSDGLDALPADVSRRFAPQIAYIDHYTGEAGGRFRRFRETRVAVLGQDDVARWCALSLVRNGVATVAVQKAPAGGDDPFAETAGEAAALAADGCPVDLVRLDASAGPGWESSAGYDVVVASAGPRVLTGLLEAGVPEGTRLLPAWTFGSKAVVGPLMSAGAAGCWACAALRLGANGQPGAAADVWSSACLDRDGESSGRQVSGPSAAMLGNLLGYEVFRLTTGALAAETEGRLVLQDLDSLDVTTEPLLPHPACPYCRTSGAPEVPADPAGELAESGLPADVAAGLTADGLRPEGDVAPEEDADRVLAELDARAGLVHPHAGVFSGYADDTWEQTPLKVGTVRVGVGHAGQREISAFDVHHVAGARLRALHRAAEVYTEHVVPQAHPLDGAALETAHEKWSLVGPSSLDTSAGTGARADQVRAWVRATSLTDGRTALVPAGAVRTFGRHNQDRIFVPTSAGSGSGPSAAVAAARGLQSALAFHALTQALRARTPVSLVPAGPAADDRELVFLRRSAGNLGLDAELLALGPADGPAAVLLARAADPATGRTWWASAARGTRRQAAVDALRDLLGQVQLARRSGDAAPADTGDPLLGDLDAGTLVVTGEAALAESGPAGGGEAPDHLALSAGLRARGLTALAVPTGSADLRTGGIHVVRILLVHGAIDAL